jgi:hypothetical protein
MDRKWIYLNEPSTSDPVCCGKQLCLGECCRERRKECEFEEDENERPLELPPLKVDPKECYGCQLKCDSSDGRHYDPTYEECGWERKPGCEFEEVEEGQTLDVSDEEYITNATRPPQIDVDGYVEEYFPKTVEEYNKYIGDLEDQHWWVWWKNECK